MTTMTTMTASPTSKAAFDLPAKTKAEKARAKRILDGYYKHYPVAECALHFSNPHELLVAVILSAQTTDAAVNRATPVLFEKFQKPGDYARATPADIEPYVRTLGFFRNKAKAIHAAMTKVAEEYGGSVPRTMEELLALRGVARKTANVVLGTAFDINEGVVVDTHVQRLSRRFSLTKHSDPRKIELDLMALFPRPHWTQLSHMMIQHGRLVCKARGALCAEDPLCQKFCSNAKEQIVKEKPPAAGKRRQQGTRKKR